MTRHPCLSILDDPLALLGRDLMDGPFRCRRPLARRALRSRRAPARRPNPALAHRVSPVMPVVATPPGSFRVH